MNRGWVVALMLFSSSVYAKDWYRCFDQMEARYQLPKNILKAIAEVESGLNPKAFNANKNKYGIKFSEDIGVMQINTYHLKTLAKYGISKQDLWNPCTNIQVGAWVLWDNINRLGWNWNAIGAYNARSTDKRRIYAAKIAKAWKKYQ